ncbi:MAG: 3-deoxy-manno-octulosonate cytidylyltransferase [Bacteroidota bacterium]
MKIIGIIPSRYASQRLPAKSLADICGKPMVQHVYERAKQSRLLTDVIVATDDERIETAVKKFGGNVVMTPATIQSGSDRVAFAARSLDADIVVNVQGDEPLIEPALIDQTIQLLVDDNEVVVGTAVKKITTLDELLTPTVVKAVIDKNHFALYFTRSLVPFVRDSPEVTDWLKHAIFYKHFGIYVYRGSFLQHYTSLTPTPLEQAEKLEQLRILEHGFRIKVAMTAHDSIPVDTQEDLDRVRAKFKVQNKDI